MGYLTRWAEEKSVKDCTGDMTTMFLYGYVLTRFGCSKVLVSDKAMHFLNEMISALTEEFQVYHQKSTPYHRQENRTIEAFNKILENALMKICNVQWNEWNVHVPAILWAYKTTCKKMIGKTPFKLVDGVEAVIPMEYIVPRLCIKSFMNMEDLEPLEEWIAQLMELEEYRFLVGFHQQVQKQSEKTWHDRHIQLRTFKVDILSSYMIVNSLNFQVIPYALVRDIYCQRYYRWWRSLTHEAEWGTLSGKSEWE